MTFFIKYNFIKIVFILHATVELNSLTTLQKYKNTLSELQMKIKHKWDSYINAIGLRRQDPSVTAPTTPDDSAEREWAEHKKNMSIDIATVRPESFYEPYWNDTNFGITPMEEQDSEPSKYNSCINMQYCLLEDFMTQTICAYGRNSTSGDMVIKEFPNLCTVIIHNCAYKDFPSQFVPMYKGPCKLDYDVNVVQVTGPAERLKRAKKYLARVTDFPEDPIELMEHVNKTKAKLWKGKAFK